MLLFDCPNCGPASEAECRYGGPAGRPRPDLSCMDREWAQYLFDRDNPLGLHRELWCHSYGCGQWFVVVRHSGSHAIESCEPVHRANSDQS